MREQRSGKMQTIMSARKSWRRWKLAVEAETRATSGPVSITPLLKIAKSQPENEKKQSYCPLAMRR